jgi:hypothetical protein
MTSNTRAEKNLLALWGEEVFVFPLSLLADTTDGSFAGFAEPA